MLSLLAALLSTAASPAWAGSSFDVGSFTKSTTTAGLPVSQVVNHGLGTTPKALILWSVGATSSGSFEAAYHFALGFTDGTTTRCISAASEDNVATSNSSRRCANKALTFVEWGEVVIAEANFSSWDSTTFTLSWTINDSSARVIHYAVIGGNDVSAKVVGWTMPTSTGSKAITGVGFQPNVILHAHLGTGFTNAPPANELFALTGLGAMDASGDQWGMRQVRRDDSGVANRIQLTDAVVVGVTPTLKGSFESVDADGFTVNFSSVSTAGQMFSLCLKGVHAAVGNFAKSTNTSTPAPQSISGLGFTPSLVLLASYQDVAGTASIDHGCLGFGVSNGTTQGSVALHDKDGTTTVVDRIDKTDKVFVKVNNSTPAVDAEASLSSMDSGGFTLSWTTNDAVATQIGYIALGPLSATAATVDCLAAEAGPEGASIRWATGHEINTLGFHVWRESADGPRRLTGSPLAGTVFLAGPGSPVAGRSYSFLDPAGREGDRYWIEDLDLGGGRTRWGPVAAKRRGIGPAAPPASSAASAAPAHASPSVASKPAFARHPDSSSIIPRPRADDDWRRALQLALAASGAIKLLVHEEGWQRLARSRLLDAGLPAGAAPWLLHLFAGGSEVPLRITGAWKPQIDPADALEFLAEPSPQNSEARVFWLVQGSRPGKRLLLPRIPVRIRAPPARALPVTIEVKPETLYFAALRNGDASNFFGPPLPFGERLEFPLEVPLAAASPPGPARLEVSVLGVTEGRHLLSVLLEGEEVGRASFEGRTIGSLRVDVPADRLRDGLVPLAIESVGGDGDLSLLERVRLAYWHATQMHGGSLRFLAHRGRYTIGGLRSARVRVVDVTLPGEPRLIAFDAAQVGDSFLVTFGVPSPREVLLLEADSSGAPDVVRDRPSRWHAFDPGADLVAIGPRSLLPSIEPLLAFHEGEGLRTAAIDVQDIYDEFGTGSESPEALREFFEWAASRWQTAPRWVILAGDASFNPEGRLGKKEKDLVPTKLLDTAELETACDDWLTDFDGDGVPDIAIGRLPVRTPAQAEAVVAKILARQAAPGSWRRRALLIADDSDGFSFEGAARELVSILPPGTETELLDRGTAAEGEARSRLVEALRQGRGLAIYLGHGSVESWRGGLLSTEDVPTLENGPRFPLLIALTCLNSYFQDVYTESLAEELLREPNGGAVAVWASSGITLPGDQASMARAFLNALADEGTTIGEAVRAAKAATEDPDVRRTWILLGDPALRLP